MCDPQARQLSGKARSAVAEYLQVWSQENTFVTENIPLTFYKKLAEGPGVARKKKC